MDNTSRKLIKPGHLLASWATYWSVLAITTLWRPALVAWQLTRRAGGTISAGLNNSQLSISMSRDGQQVLEQSASLGQVAAWLVVPPLLILGVWGLVRSSQQRQLGRSQAAALEAGAAPAHPVAVRDRAGVRDPITPLP